MSRYSAFVLFLAIVPLIFCAADPIDYPNESPFADTTTPTTTAETTTTTTAETTATSKATTTTAAPPTTTTTTAAPTTTSTTAAPTTTSTTAAPTTTSTTAAPTTTTSAPNTTSTAPNTTSTAPSTTSTMPTPTTTPVPPLPNPTAQLYEVKNDKNESCLMVKFGLRIGFQGAKYEEMNFEVSNKTVVHGTCEEDNSTLVIQDDTLTLSLTFHNDTKKFSLHALNATGKMNSGVTFSETNSTLILWQASLGSSYMCKKEQNYNVTKNLTIFTFELHVQPFGIKKNSFSTAEDCMADGESFIVPIAVGVALLVLILIVLVAYFIGRKRNMASGYESF